MSTYTQILYHIIFSTKNRIPCLIKENRKELFKFIWGILKNKKCHLYQINGVEDHLHIVTHLHPTEPLAMLVKDIKIGSNKYIKGKQLFSAFNGQQEGYAAFTYTIKDKEKLIHYVKNQEQRHRNMTFIEELTLILEEHDIDFDEKYLN